MILMPHWKILRSHQLLANDPSGWRSKIAIPSLLSIIKITILNYFWKETKMSNRVLEPGITRAGEGQSEVVWNILGHTYYLKSLCETSFCFETYDPPGTFVPLHIHPTQDEFIY